LNTFEESLLRQSVFGELVATAWRSMPTDSLRNHLELSMNSLVGLADPAEQRLVLAHLLMPHTPFLWGAGGAELPAPAWWPSVQLFESVTEKIGISHTGYADGLRDQIEVVNRRVVDAVDAIVERDPRAVIVVFSDHGARYAEAAEKTEWHRSFLAARTPEHPQLFEIEPTPTAILRRILEAYGS
jgi:hypothetical protein